MSPFPCSGPRLLRAAGAYTVKAQRGVARRGRRCGLGVENDQAMFRFGSRRHGGRSVACLATLEAVAQCFVGQQGRDDGTQVEVCADVFVALR